MAVVWTSDTLLNKSVTVDIIIVFLILEVFFTFEDKLRICHESESHAIASNSLRPHGFPRPEPWSGQPSPALGGLPNPGLPQCRRIPCQLRHQGSCALVTHALYCAEAHSLYAHSIESFYRKWVLSLVKCSVASIEMIIWFYSIVLLMGWITLIDLRVSNHLCIPGINYTSLWYMIFLMYNCSM